jgi:hypothetical protein
MPLSRIDTLRVTLTVPVSSNHGLNLSESRTGSKRASPQPQEPAYFSTPKSPFAMVSLLSRFGTMEKMNVTLDLRAL